MEKFELNGKWHIKSNTYDVVGDVPGSVYSALLANGLMEDPFYRDNEAKALAVIDEEFTFTKEFEYEKKSDKFCWFVRGSTPFATCISTMVSWRIPTICIKNIALTLRHF